ncbi:MAG: molecular chaperone DnaK [Capsulimonadaceae bacterium]|nr:molecular chaperone DnaK [Capsulimonadaceae bacterium]
MGRSVGIDLGTTNSVVAVLEAGKPVVIPLSEGSTLCPSVVGFSKNGERLVGYLAKRQAITNPDRTISSIKRQMGTNTAVNIDGKDYSPEQISAMILEKLRTDAEGYLGEKVTEAVITVPAYFSNAQREATKHAGEIAGLEVVRIVNEPTAACLSYGQNRDEGGMVLVWDLGGGTYDVSILEITGDIFEVLSTNGDTRLGGDDWDQRVMDWLVSEFVAANPDIDIRSDLIAMQRIKEAAEKAKIELSSVLTTNVNLPFLSSGPAGPVHLETALTRAKLEDMTRDLLDRMVGPTEQALSDANLKSTDIKRILLVGGSTRMPAVQALIRQKFNQDPFKGINPDEVVAQGAALQAGIVSGDVRDLVLIDVTPLSLGIETQGGVFTRLIDRNTAIPTSHSQLFTTAIDDQNAVDIHVLQGERDFARDNKTLGKFQLSGIPEAPRGMPRIEVTFDIDVNGIVHVSARDLATDNVQKVTITASSGLSRAEVSKMVEEAERYRQADAKRRDEQEIRNKAEQVVYSAKKLIEDAKDYVRGPLVTDVSEAAAVLQNALNNFDMPGTQQGMDQLDKAVFALSQALSEARNSPRPAPAAEPGNAVAAPAVEAVEEEPVAEEAESDEFILDTDGPTTEDFTDV